MANFKGANLRYDNSDNQDRVYDISAEAVMEGTVVKDVRSISLISKNGGSAYGSVSNVKASVPDSNFGFQNLPVEEYTAAMEAMRDFAMTLASLGEETANIAGDIVAAH